MSTRWMAVQFIGDTLRLPIVNKPDMDKPFGSSELERKVRRIVVNPFSDNPQTFIPEAENSKLRELCMKALVVLENNCSECAYFYDCDILTDCKCAAPKKIRAELRELGIEELDA